MSLAERRLHRWTLVALGVIAAWLGSEMVGCDEAAQVGGRPTTAPTPTLTLDAAAVPADFVTLKHASEDLVVRAPPGWAFFQQPFRRQNDVLVGLFPPGSVWTGDPQKRLYLHGHVLPDGVTFEQYVRGHESGSYATNEGQTFISSEPALLNGLPAHKWVSVGKPPDGRPETKRLMVAAVKGRTVYYAEFRAPPEEFDELAPLAEQAVASLTIGEPKPWPNPPPPAIPRRRPEQDEHRPTQRDQ